MASDAPPGATHFIPASPLDFTPQPLFFKWAPTVWLPESEVYLYGWYWWDRGAWVRDTTFSNRLDVLKPIAEFTEDV